MINQTIQIFEQLAQQPSYQAWLHIDQQPMYIQQATAENNPCLIKQLFCDPSQLADKTTVFQA